MGDRRGLRNRGRAVVRLGGVSSPTRIRACVRDPPRTGGPLSGHSGSPDVAWSYEDWTVHVSNGPVEPDRFLHGQPDRDVDQRVHLYGRAARPADRSHLRSGPARCRRKRNRPTAAPLRCVVPRRTASGSPTSPGSTVRRPRSPGLLWRGRRRALVASPRPCSCCAAASQQHRSGRTGDGQP